MGIILSRLCNMGEIPLEYLISIFHLRNIFYLGRSQNRHTNWGRSGRSSLTDGDSSARDDVSTQTDDEKSNPSNSSQKADVALNPRLAKETGTISSHAVSADRGSEVLEDTIITMSSSSSNEEDVVKGSSSVRSDISVAKASIAKAKKRQTEKRVSEMERSSSPSSSDSDTARITCFQRSSHRTDQATEMASLSSLSSLSLNTAAICTSISSSDSVKSPALQTRLDKSEGMLLARERVMEIAVVSADDYDGDFSSEGTSSASSDYNDICIFENPDFTQFGRQYHNLVSPNDKLASLAECGRVRGVSTLSPVKEEETDADLTNLAPKDPSPNPFHARLNNSARLNDSSRLNESARHSGGVRLNLSARLNETFPVFPDSSDSSSATPRSARISSSSSSSDGSIHGERWDGRPSGGERAARGKKLFCCSFSSDSGIGGERLRGSSRNTSVCVSTSDSDCNTSSDLSSVSHSDDLDLDDLGSRNEVFRSEEGQVDEGCSDQGARLEASADDDDRKGRDDAPAASGLKRVLTLAPVPMKARRRVTFSDSVPQTPESPSDNPAAISPSASTSPSSSTQAPASLSAQASLSVPASLPADSQRHVPACPPLLLKSMEPSLSQQHDLSDSSSTCSSSDSSLASPLSPPDSPFSDNESAFVFPETANSFAETSEGSDLVLVAEGERFHVHRSVVAWQCRSLHAHLMDTGSHEVVLLDRKAEDVLCFLSLLYPYHRQSVTDHNVEGLLDLSLWLGCERVRRVCATYLLGLAHFKHLCPHRHLAPSPRHPQRHGHPHASDQHAGGKGDHHVRFAGREFGSGCDPCSASSDDGAVTSPAWQARSRGSVLCRCRDTVAERVMGVLALSVRFQLDDVYAAFLHVAAALPSQDLTLCPKYDHLSAALREDILLARVTRLENGLNVSRSDLVGCRKGRHQNYRLSFNGDLCLRCISRNLSREDRDSSV